MPWRWRWALGVVAIAVMSSRFFAHHDSRSKAARKILLQWADKGTVDNETMIDWLESEGIHENKDFKSFPNASESLKHMIDDSEEDYFDLSMMLAPRSSVDFACTSFVALVILVLLVYGDEIETEMTVPSPQTSSTLLDQEEAKIVEIEKIVNWLTETERTCYNELNNGRKENEQEFAESTQIVKWRDEAEANRKRVAELEKVKDKLKEQLLHVQQDRAKCDNKLRKEDQRRLAESMQKRADERAHMMKHCPVFKEAMSHVGADKVQDSTDFCLGFEIGRIDEQKFEGTFSACCPESGQVGQHFIGGRLWDGQMVVYHDMKKMLAKGGEGAAREYVDALTKEKVVCKHYQEKASLAMASEWASLMRIPRCDNVVHIRQVIQVDKRVYMFMDRLEGQELFNACKNKALLLDERSCAVVCEGAAKGLAHLHENGIIHGDVKAENFMISETLEHVTLIDFGFSVRTSRVENSRRPDPSWYDPPEHLRICPQATRDENGIERRHMWVSKQADVWRLGVTFFVVLAKYPPFYPAQNTHECQQKQLRCDWNRERVGTRSPEAIALLESIFKLCPASRPTTQEILAHRWFLPRPASANR